MSNTRVLDCGRYLLLPGRKLAGYAIRFSRESLLKVGILRKVTDLLARQSIPILFLSISRPELNKPVEALIFVDLTMASISKSDLKSELLNIADIENVELIEPIHDSLLVDTYFEKLVLGSERAVIFRKPIYEALIMETVRQLGSGGKALLYHIGRNMGKSVYKDYVKMIGGEKLDVLLEVGKAFFKLIGLGVLEIPYINMEKKEALLRVFDSFECTLYKRAEKPVSSLVKGIFAGWFSELFKTEMEVEEKKCIAMGSPYCEFFIKMKA